MSDQLVAETSTWQHTTLTTDRHPCPRWDFFLPTYYSCCAGPKCTDIVLQQHKKAVPVTCHNWQCTIHTSTWLSLWLAHILQTCTPPLSLGHDIRRFHQAPIRRIRTHDLSRRAAVDLCLRPCGHWDRQVFIRSSLKLVLIYTFLILDTYHPDALYLREKGCEDPWLFLGAKMGPRAKPFEKHCFSLLIIVKLCEAEETVARLALEHWSFA